VEEFCVSKEPDKLKNNEFVDQFQLKCFVTLTCLIIIIPIVQTNNLYT
jgi:hypothetical protein